MKFCAYLSNFLRDLRKTGSILQNVNLFATRVVANWSKFTVSAQNQLIEGLLKNYDYATLNRFLLIIQIFKLRDKN